MNKRREEAPLYRQSMGLWINEPLVRRPAEIDASIHALADAGYDIVRLFIRNTNYTHRSPEIVAAVKRAVHVAHRSGLRAVLDCEPHDLVGRDMIRQFPDAMGSKLVRYAVRVVDGHWVIRATPPSFGGGTGGFFDGVEAAFLCVGGHMKKVRLDYTVSRGTKDCSNGHIHRETFYREGVPGSQRQVHEMRGQLPAVVAGELAVYVRFEGRNFVDFWAIGFRRYFEELLECYRGIPLDGVGWDEPAVDGDWHSYRYGTAFAAAFKKLNGYDLADKLYLLDEPGFSVAAVKVRLDYYRTLNEGLARAQADLIRTAHGLFGKRLILGTHHTWQGEGGSNDYRAGAVDYFRLNDNMDAGYTDCSWWDPASVAYAYTLASSLGRLTPSGEAEPNTWHFNPTVASVRRNVSLMTLMNVNWFNIWFGRDCDCVLQQGHYTWPETVAGMQRHKELQRRIGPRRPVIDVAVWQGWEGVCGWNQPGLANAQKTFCLNTSELFIQRNIAMDFIDSRLLADSRIQDGRLVNRLGRYRVLVMPYASVLPRKAFAMCAAFARAGGKVVFVGMPVSADEDGISLAKEFAGLLDVPVMSAEHYLAGIQAACTLPDYRPQRLEVCRPLPADWPRLLVSCEGEPHGVVSKDGSVVFLTDFDPQQRLIERIEGVLPVNVQAHGGNLLWRLYDDALVVVASDNRPMCGVVKWGGRWIELTGGSAGILELREGMLSFCGDVIGRELPR